MHTTGKLEGIVFKASLPITSGIFSCRHGGMAEYFLLSQGTCGGVGECHAAGSRDTSLVSHRALVAQSKIYCPTRSPRAIARSGGGRGKGGEDTWINMTGGRTSKLGCVHIYTYMHSLYNCLENGYFDDILKPEDETPMKRRFRLWTKRFSQFCLFFYQDGEVDYWHSLISWNLCQMSM